MRTPLLLCLGLLLAAACNESTTSGGNGGTGGSGGSGGTGGSSGGSGGGGGAPAPTCADYCALIATNCTGAVAQYSSEASCLGVCAEFPIGAASDTAGNTVGCRIYHAGAAATLGLEHCEHAGPGGAGLCGDDCEGFCAVATEVCPTEWPVATCAANCAAIADPVVYSANVAAGDSLACRLYHLTVAASGATEAATHCPHTVQVTAPGDPCSGMP